MLVTDVVQTYFDVVKYVLKEDIVLTYFIKRENDVFTQSVGQNQSNK